MEKQKAIRDEIRRSQGFRYTNDPWNSLSLNQGWSIGLMMNIIGDKRFKTFEDWEKHYLKSGEDRKNKLKNLPRHIRERLENLRAHHDNPVLYKVGLSNEQIRINDSMGRTIEDLKLLSTVLHEEVVRRGNPFNLSIGDCMTHVYIRVVDEIYIGIQREENTIKTLEKEFPHIVFKKSKSFIDRRYAIDAEAYLNNNLLCGFQIKSPYFQKGKTEEMNKSHTYNENKMEDYRNKFNTDAYFIYAEVNGEIKNPEILKSLPRKTS